MGFRKKKFDEYVISQFTTIKIVNLFNNSDFFFLEISTNFKEMINRGYNKKFLEQSLHSMRLYPIYLYDWLSSNSSLHTMKASEN